MKEIRNILKAYRAFSHENHRLALASVVNVEESSYRRIGARMLVSSSGQWVGGISGGCLEGDALKRSQKAIFHNQPSRVVYDTMDDDKNQIGVGLGCNGRLEVLFTPISEDFGSDVIANLEKIIANKEASILLKIINVETTEEYLGLEVIVDDELSDLDFCAIDSAVLMEEIRKTRIKRRPQIVTLSNKTGEQLRVLVEFIRPETKLVVVGDNYDVRAMIGIAKELGWEIHVVGRKKKMSKSIFAQAAKVYEYESFHQIPQDEYTAVILMTHDYNWDKTLLPEFLQMDLPYVGMLGPKKRMAKMNDELPDVDLDQIHYFHAPVGLDIGAETPEEIALSITAEIVAVFREREGTSLKYRQGTIHHRD